MTKGNSGLMNLAIWGGVGAGAYYWLIKPMLDANIPPTNPTAPSGGVTAPAAPVPIAPTATQTAAPNIPATQPAEFVAAPRNPAPIAAPPDVPVSMDAPAGSTAPNFSQYIANTLGAGRHALTADAWNWHFSNWSKVPQTADLFPAGDRGALMSLIDYMNARTTAGVSGLGGIRNRRSVTALRNPGGTYIQSNKRPSSLHRK